MPMAADTQPPQLAIDFACQAVGGLGGTVIRKGGSGADFRLPVIVADGSVTEYLLSVSSREDQLSCRETSPAHLPSCCPDRHINRDGSFCITWASRLPIHVIDATSADTWWQTVYRFLQEQHRAAKKRKWPTKGDWAHGDAAQDQLRAETAAAALGGRFPSDLKHGRLTVTRKGHFHRLIGPGGWRYSVWIEFGRVATLRQPCFCPQGASKHVPLKSCGEHAQAAADLVLGMVGREREERRFWKSLKGQPCCGTMDDCPLATAQT
jgi:hypothetical protein